MPVHDPRTLAQLLPHLASLLTEVPLDAPVAVGVTLPPHADFAGATAPPVEFFFRHLDCTDVVCALGGFVAPAHWDAFGVVAPGRRTMLDAPLDAPPAEPHLADDEVTVCALLARDGLVVSEVRTLAGHVVSHGESAGRAVDACRRVLGLATAPPLLGTRVWRTLRWIDRVLAAVLDADLGDPPGWSSLAALRGCDTPPIDHELDDHEQDDHEYDDVPDAWGETAAWTWCGLRTACILDEIDVPGIDPCTAAWMDDGLFAREAVAAFPPLVESLGDLRQLVPPRTFDLIVEAVSAQLAA